MESLKCVHSNVSYSAVPLFPFGSVYYCTTVDLSFESKSGCYTIQVKASVVCFSVFCKIKTVLFSGFDLGHLVTFDLGQSRG